MTKQMKMEICKY